MNAEVWLIRFTDRNGLPQAVAHMHNCIADYRGGIDPHATAQRIDVAALAQAAQAAAEFDIAATLQRGDHSAAIHQYALHQSALRAAMDPAPAPPDGILRGNADLVPTTHATLNHTPETHA